MFEINNCQSSIFCLNLIILLPVSYTHLCSGNKRNVVNKYGSVNSEQTQTYHKCLSRGSDGVKFSRHIISNQNKRKTSYEEIRGYIQKLKLIIRVSGSVPTYFRLSVNEKIFLIERRTVFPEGTLNKDVR